MKKNDIAASPAKPLAAGTGDRAAADKAGADRQLSGAKPVVAAGARRKSNAPAPTGVSAGGDEIASHCDAGLADPDAGPSRRADEPASEAPAARDPSRRGGPVESTQPSRTESCGNDGSARIAGAVAFAPGPAAERIGIFGLSLFMGKKRRKPRQDEEEEDVFDASDAPAENPAIPGIGDRMAALAMVAGTAAPDLRPARPGRSPALPRLRPASRAECQRRCGPGGFCDPSSELGCGGIHCGKSFDRLY